VKHTPNQTGLLGKDKLQVEQDTDMRDRERTIRRDRRAGQPLAKVGSRPREGLLRRPAGDKQELTLGPGEQRDKGKEQQAGLITS
jgi:hypothetical protein